MYSRVLSNEKYRGDALLQKTFCTDFLTKKMKVNEGEVPQYYVENSHPAIVNAEVFELVQQELERRKAHKQQSGTVNARDDLRFTFRNGISLSTAIDL